LDIPAKSPESSLTPKLSNGNPVYVFENFAINRIVAEVFEYNKASMRVLEKNSYHLETVTRKGILKNELLYDNYIWVLQKIY
jgi:RimJ/RimL family protein N-acetyltransferase